MAQLSSPGVSVTVIDESFYTPAAAGTVPLIIVASAENKQNGSSTGTAAGTLKANAGQVYLMTSQKDLSDTFGTPIFKTDANNNPIHAGEQNEYGLQAAYSFLGVSNRAYVVRADIDTNQLNASADAPAGTPEDGTYWFDTANTKYGIFEWNSNLATTTGGQSFSNKVPLVITETSKVDAQTGAPKTSIGAIGDYAVVATTNLYTVWYKKDRTNSDSEATNAGWVEVGSEAWTASWPTAAGTLSNTSWGVSSGSFTVTVKNAAGDTVDTLTVSAPASLASVVTSFAALNDNGISAAAINGKLQVYSTGNTVTFTEGEGSTLLARLGLETAKVYKAPALTISSHTQVPSYKRTDDVASANGRPTGSIWVKSTNPNLGANWKVLRYNDATGAWEEKTAPLYASNQAALAGLDAAGGGMNLPLGALYVQYNTDEGASPLANFKIFARSAVGATTIKTNATYAISESLTGSATLSTKTVTFDILAGAENAVANAEAISSAINAAGFVNIVADYDTAAKVITITHKQGGDFRMVDGTGTPLSKLFAISGVSRTANLFADPSDSTNANKYLASLWTSTVGGASFITASADAPTTIPADGQLWYNSIIDEVDLMIHNGTTWVGYSNYLQNQVGGGTTDASGPTVSATAPTTQKNGSPLANGDIWISTADLENFPMIYKYNYLTKKWVLVDNSDQTTEDGILFRDARWTTGPGTGTEVATPASIVDLLTSNFLDFDAPDPALYPKGMLLWNLRRSGFNVKRFVRDYVNNLDDNERQAGESMTDYYPHRWVSEAANQENGAGTFGRKAQRKVVIQALQALVNSNQQIRDEESRVFNLIACPGYPELVGEMLSLNYDRGLTAFVVCDTPARLTPDATSLSNWGNNVAGAFEDGDSGLVSSDEYIGFFYPWGYTSDNLGNNVVVPPSHMMLRTIALSDNVSYPWFAPAGTRRGGITNATAVGYVDAEGEFRSVALNNGQRDTLASVKVNPITFITGTGLVNYGQYTRARNASSLDRINVARLVIYLRRQFSLLAKPYVFEPNDKITRDEIKGAAESLLLELVGQRALYDYLVVCDESNNTPARIDRNELYLDVAIEPVKAVEFIYIPLRLKNTGEIKGLA
jgi:uncharacterized protein YjfI (DUF2170 family)